MKKSIAYLLIGLSILNLTTPAIAQDETMTHRLASYIPMTAASQKAEAFAQFLSGAAPLVKETEPGTELWFALRGASENQLAIFDVFRDEAARDAHFSGAVAGALEANASELVEGGWDDGVVANVNHAEVLSEKAPADLYDATTATYIMISAVRGQGDNLAELLTAAGPIVANTEPKTLYWVALRLDQDNFAIFDIFADETGREAHFAGQVASLLKEQSSTLVADGWEDGVVVNVSNYTILAIK
ncbi:MAG: hypothetical protein QNJ11_19700 [Woeseiaceae bacterium]|nr:hypothetical protein [Woeseiaceae bacterium]